jgi:predicted nuclease of restriction endonuclease-like (RecB) superfamily/predicted transport protein
MSRVSPLSADKLYIELSALIASSRQRLAGAVNAELTRLYWTVGQRLATEVLGGERAQYGSQLMARLGRQLTAEFGRGFEAKNLRRMVQFVQAFPESEKVASLMRQLSWTHFLQLIPVKPEPARSFYAQQCAEQRWSVRELRQQIERKAFERTEIASAQVPGLPAVEKETPALVFKDPYFLDFLGLRQGHDEADLEGAILRQLEAFILELGRGFAFVERQKRLVIDGEDFYLDLLFFHRRLRRLVAIELKLGRFKAAHKGQMASMPEALIELLVSLEDYILSLGDDVQVKELRLYVAFKRLKNFVTLVPQQKRLVLYLHLDPAGVLQKLPQAKDVSAKGHWGTGNVEFGIATQADLEAAKPFIAQAYEGLVSAL